VHLHDVFRSWRAEILEGTQVAVVEEDLGPVRELVSGLPHDAIPGGLRRDDPSGLRVRLLPASHHPQRPASDDDLDALEETLGFELPREVELLLRLHDGGDFYRPDLEGLVDPLDKPLRLLSSAQMGEAYTDLVHGLRTRLIERGADHDDFVRIARRFGIGRGDAKDFADQLARLVGGRDPGLRVIPLVRPPSRPDDLLIFVVDAGTDGRVGYAAADAGFLPDHSDDLAFDGLGGWLNAVLRGRACRRVVLT